MKIVAAHNGDRKLAWWLTWADRKLACWLTWAGLLVSAVVVTIPRPILASDATPSTSTPVKHLYAGKPPANAAGLKKIQRQIQMIAPNAVSCTVGIIVGLSHGSGVIVSPDGTVITAAHVVGRPGTGVRLMLASGRELRGKVLGRNPQSDVGVIKIVEQGDWPFARMGNSDDVRAGQWCLATGHPGGYEGGRNPALRIGRVTGAWSSTIRTDCTLIRGDSGGPLFDLAGHVVGIHSRVGAAVAANLHVPMDAFHQDWSRLLVGYDGEAASRIVDEQGAGQQGAGEQGAGQQGAGQHGVKPNGAPTKRPTSKPGQDLHGAARRHVQGPPARESGKNHELVRSAFRDVISVANRATVRLFTGGKLVAIGVIVDAEGHVLTKASEIRGPILCRFADGRRVPARVVAVDASHDLALVRVPRNDLTPIRFRSQDQLTVGSILATPGGFGDKPIAVGVVSLAPRRVHGVTLGIRIGHSDNGPIVGSVQPESSAAKAGLLPRDVILGVDGENVPTTQALLEKIRDHRPGDVVRLRVRRGEDQLELHVSLARAGQRVPGRDSDRRTTRSVISDRRFDFPLVVQHDSALYANQCGGPVVDLDGMVVGINIARASRVASYAIPAERVVRVIVKLMSAARGQPPPAARPARQIP